jgi:hypothetical protein
VVAEWENGVACLAGTKEEPRKWVRFKNGQPIHMEGRWCERALPWTSRRSCSPCPAYRGVNVFGQRVTGLAPNEDPIALSADEYERYEAAIEATYDDDFSLYCAFLDRLREGVGERTMREHGDPGAQDRWAAYIRGYRQRMSDEQKERQREYMKRYMREYRKRKVSTPEAQKLG